MSPNPLPGSLASVAMDGELPRRGDLPVVFDELDYQMACQAYLWALPLVSYAQWQRVHRGVFGATNSDIVHYVTYQDRLGLITANATTPYILSFVDLGETGPLVVELPPGPTAGGVSDFWQREIGVMGEMGPDKGKGGKHVIVGPGQSAPPDADGLFALQATGMNIMFGFRTLDPDPAAREGVGRRGTHLSLRPARGSSAHARDLTGRPPVVGRSAARPCLLGAPARDLSA